MEFSHGKESQKLVARYKNVRCPEADLRRRKGGVKKKAMAALLVFIMATLEIVFARKKAVGHKRSIWR